MKAESVKNGRGGGVFQGGYPIHSRPSPFWKICHKWSIQYIQFQKSQLTGGSPYQLKREYTGLPYPLPPSLPYPSSDPRNFRIDFDAASWAARVDPASDWQPSSTDKSRSATAAMPHRAPSTRKPPKASVMAPGAAAARTLQLLLLPTDDGR